MYVIDKIHDLITNKFNEANKMEDKEVWVLDKWNSLTKYIILNVKNYKYICF